ncbi:hypothetical protein AOQ84DRAFT_413927 [Glonium stellatum]|uniref:Uncharacterized protein n=1 Tax=Glonium stellatum TaxID=574774 RepID=A0A8E2EUW5_9PEZI|nr:hypothetical protein AOQ84DRAFT_413927 [Glonium stellatum]
MNIELDWASLAVWPHYEGYGELRVGLGRASGRAPDLNCNETATCRKAGLSLNGQTALMDLEKVDTDDGLHKTPAEKLSDILPELLLGPHPSDYPYPEVYHGHGNGGNPASSVEPLRNELPGSTINPKGRRYCGLRPPTFFLNLMLFAVIVAGTIGGAVRGAIATTTSGNAKATSLVTSPSSTPTILAIAACGCDGNKFIVHQNPFGDLYMLGYYNQSNKWNSPTQISITNPAIEKTPLAAVCWPWGVYLLQN